jgi:hypothetical protein
MKVTAFIFPFSQANQGCRSVWTQYSGCLFGMPDLGVACDIFQLWGTLLPLSHFVAALDHPPSAGTPRGPS